MSHILVALTLIPVTWEAEVDRCLWAWSQPGLRSKSQDSQSYIVRPWLGKILFYKYDIKSISIFI